MAINAAVPVAVPELTATQVAAVLVRPLEAQSLFLAAGPRIFDTAGPLRIPKLGAPTDPSWTGESELIPEVNPNFDEVSLLPSTMKSVKTLTRYSNELARQAVVSLDQALRDRLVSDVAAKLDTQFFSASGDGTTTPKGIFAYTYPDAAGGRRTDPGQAARRMGTRPRGKRQHGRPQVGDEPAGVHRTPKGQGRLAAVPAPARPDPRRRVPAIRRPRRHHRPGTRHDRRHPHRPRRTRRLLPDCRRPRPRTERQNSRPGVRATTTSRQSG